MLEESLSSRAVTKERHQACAGPLVVRGAEEDMDLGRDEVVLYEDQVSSVLAALVEGNEPADYASAVDKDMPEAVSLRDYISANAISTKKLSKNKVAVIYAEGSITGGESSRDVVGSTTVAKQLAKARKDKNVKAVVFRVNSPGGSALASEVMWRELELLRAEKPVVVSMGNYAASGGYYISAPADVILADRTTLTGSIGVFGMVPNLQKALKNKLGITIDVVKTGPSADMGMGFRGLSGDERNFFMYQIEQTYSTFVNHVADGRNMTFEEVDAIGQGRVWLGVDAMEIGLIDGFGGIKEAISLAAERAGVSDDFRIYEVVDEKTSINMLLQAAFSARQSALRNELGDAFAEYNHIMQVINEPGVQARMPYTIEVY